MSRISSAVFGPDEWLGILVPLVDPGADVAFEVDPAAVGRAAQRAPGQFSEPAFDEVEPGAAGGGEVQVEPGVAQQPSFLRFLQTIDKAVPAELDLHLICNTYGTHTPPEVKKSLVDATVPQ